MRGTAKQSCHRRWTITLALSVAVAFLLGIQLCSLSQSMLIGVNVATSTTQETGGEEANAKIHIYEHNFTSMKSAVDCNTDQRSLISKQLSLNNGGGDIGVYTNCPDATWLETYYSRLSHAKRRDDGGMSYFTGISIGCNKGFDAIRTARMGMNDPRFDNAAWRAATEFGNSDKCGQANAEQKFQLKNNNSASEGEMHCIEAMPSTHNVLKRAASNLDLGSNFILQNAAISSKNGHLYFPNSTSGKEFFSIDMCNGRGAWYTCVAVPAFTLQTYVEKFVKSRGVIDILQIDVEGWDFDVLFGAGSVLDRTNYLEFEYHDRGNWGQYHLQDAVKLLDRKGFTCYWSGKGKLWRITDCYFDTYDVWHGWSNVACVHRTHIELAEIMENVFESTLQLDV